MKQIYKTFFVFLIISLFSMGITFKILAQQNTVVTKVGSPKGGTNGWPTTGVITQGPMGAFDHVNIFNATGAEAIDIANNSSPPIYSVFDGTVIAVHDCTADGDCSRGFGGYGNSVEIKSTNGGSALYGHLSIILVSTGQSVSKGEQIGVMGNTGVSTGPHLHFELRGIPLLVPNIPENITPSDCDTPRIACQPVSI